MHFGPPPTGGWILSRPWRRKKCFAKPKRPSLAKTASASPPQVRTQIFAKEGCVGVEGTLPFLTKHCKLVTRLSNFDTVLSAEDLRREEEESLEKLRVDLIRTVAHTVIMEAAANGMYLTLQDFSKVVESDSEFFSHMNLHL